MLQKRGHVVGYMGDGINDALALEGFGRGDFGGHGGGRGEGGGGHCAGEEPAGAGGGFWRGGRCSGTSSSKIRMGASSNFGNMFSFTGGTVLLPFGPMTSPQILVNNLLYDFSGAGDSDGQGG